MKDSFLIVASDYKPKPGGRADYIDNLARGLIQCGNRTRVLAVVQPHQKERLAFLKRYEDWVIPFETVYDKRPQNWVGNKLVSALEILRCVAPQHGPYWKEPLSLDHRPIRSQGWRRFSRARIHP